MKTFGRVNIYRQYDTAIFSQFYLFPFICTVKRSSNLYFTLQKRDNIRYLSRSERLSNIVNKTLGVYYFFSTIYAIS